MLSSCRGRIYVRYQPRIRHLVRFWTKVVGADVMLALLCKQCMKALDIQNKEKLIISILQKGGYESDTAGSDRKLIVKLSPPPSTESPHKHLTICAL
jgi:hypothetical protein